MKTIQHAYNLPMRWLRKVLFTVLAITAALLAQQPQSADAIAITTDKLTKASLWNYYSFDLQASAGTPPYHWRVSGGSLPHGLELQENGTLMGKLAEQGNFDFVVTARDQLGKQQSKTFTLSTETPLITSWSKRVEVNGRRIDGSIKVTNTTGRDLDLTFIVLAVNDIGRATAIGYQHFSLKQNTRDQELPFGDTLSAGNYDVNVDVVGEEPQSNMIFRSRLASGSEAVTQGP